MAWLQAFASKQLPVSLSTLFQTVFEPFIQATTNDNEVIPPTESESGPLGNLNDECMHHILDFLAEKNGNKVFNRFGYLTNMDGTVSQRGGWRLSTLARFYSTLVLVNKPWKAFMDQWIRHQSVNVVFRGPCQDPSSQGRFLNLSEYFSWRRKQWMDRLLGRHREIKAPRQSAASVQAQAIFWLQSHQPFIKTFADYRWIGSPPNRRSDGLFTRYYKTSRLAAINIDLRDHINFDYYSVGVVMVELARNCPMLQKMKLTIPFEFLLRWEREQTFMERRSNPQGQHGKQASLVLPHLNSVDMFFSLSGTSSLSWDEDFPFLSEAFLAKQISRWPSLKCLQLGTTLHSNEDEGPAFSIQSRSLQKVSVEGFKPFHFTLFDLRGCPNLEEFGIDGSYQDALLPAARPCSAARGYPYWRE